LAIWDQLNTKTIKDFASEDIQRQSNPIHLEESNRQALMDIVLINLAQQRDGMPIPDQGKVVQTTGDNDRIQFQPNPGECWKLVGGDILETASGTFTVNFQLRDLDGNIAFIGTSSSTGQEPITVDAFFEGEVYVTNALYLYSDVTGGEGRVSTAFVRVR